MKKKEEEMENLLREERNAKEVLLSNQQASFHDQLTKLHSEFEEQKDKLIQEQNKIKEDADKQVTPGSSLPLISDKKLKIDFWPS